MKIIVDANIVFSGILNTNGKIGDLLINSGNYFQFIVPDFLRLEIRKHYSRLAKISGMNFEDITEAEFLICKDMTFISAEQIPSGYWRTAEKLVRDIDPKDTHYIAYARYFRCKLWTGDKKLKTGLEKKGIKNIMTTDDVYRIRKEITK